jgi:pimeloyl-ACP methyl ester carboxylesterase
MRTFFRVAFGALLIAGLAGSAVAQPPAAVPAAQRTGPWTEKYWTNAEGVRFHYVELGTGTPVILIHGAGGTALGNWFYNGIAESLAKTNRVIGLDMRNHGLTTPNPAPAGNMARDVLAFMDAQGIRKAHIGGYSMGGFVTGQIMAIAPDRFITAHFGGSGVQELPEFRGLVPPDKTGTPEMEQQASARFNATRQQPGATVGNGAGRAAPPPAQPAAAPAPSGAPAPPAGGLPGMTGSAGNPPLDLTKIDFPVLQVMGEYDRPNASGHRLWRELGNYQRTILPGRGHLSAIAPTFIHPLYIQSLTTFISSNNPK